MDFFKTLQKIHFINTLKQIISLSNYFYYISPFKIYILILIMFIFFKMCAKNDQNFDNCRELI